MVGAKEMLSSWPRPFLAPLWPEQGRLIPIRVRPSLEVKHTARSGELAAGDTDHQGENSPPKPLPDREHTIRPSRRT